GDDGGTGGTTGGGASAAGDNAQGAGGASPSAYASDAASAAPSAEETPESAPSTPAAAAAADEGGLPAITSGKAFGETPTLAVGRGTPPTELVVRTLHAGTGTPVAKGDHVSCHYVLQAWDRTGVLDSSFARGEPLVAQVGVGQLIEGWDTALLGKSAGSRLEFAVPPALGYGPQGQGEIKGTDVLVFVVDILTVSSTPG
ncbi:FKBP-type peptidyl-prolyl cis-trans isomerase, partial [Kitasatospora sp. NPDC004240]